MSQSITGNPSPAANVLADRVETGLNKKIYHGYRIYGSASRGRRILHFLRI